MTNNDSSTPETERNKLTVLRFMELMDARDFDALGEVLAPDLQLRLGGSVLDRQETEAMIRTVYDAFPDWTHTVEEVLAADDRVVLRATDRATHRGVFEGIAPTGRQIIVGQIGIYRMVNGLIAEIWEQFDMFGLMQQLSGAGSSVEGGIETPASRTGRE